MTVAKDRDEARAVRRHAHECKKASCDARSLTRLLADFIHESDAVDCQRVAHGMEAIGALMHMGVQCTAQAHARMCWEQAKE
jgi:hypothetical protein